MSPLVAALLAAILALPAAAIDDGKQKEPPPPPCTGDKEAAVAAAREEANRRLDAAYRSLQTPPPWFVEKYRNAAGPRAAADPNKIGPAYVEALNALFKDLFQQKADWNAVMGTFGEIYQSLGKATLSCPDKSDEECGEDTDGLGRAAYVKCRGKKCAPVVYLCDKLFTTNSYDPKPVAEKLARNIIHESAHLARIGTGGKGEAYCLAFDCWTGCGSPHTSADGWTHLIHCMSGQTKDEGGEIVGEISAR